MKQVKENHREELESANTDSPCKAASEPRAKAQLTEGVRDTLPSPALGLSQSKAVLFWMCGAGVKEFTRAELI